MFTAIELINLGSILATAIETFSVNSSLMDQAL